MLLSSIGSVRYASIYGKVVVKPIHVNHEFHKVIKWVKPEYIRPWHPQRSCDLVPLPKVDLNWLKLEFRPFADIIDKLPEEHRKLFTVGYGHRRDGIAIIMEDTLKLVKEHVYDEKSLEFRIAKCTIKIRNFQDQFARYEYVRKVGANKKRAKELVEKRKKLLTWLRAADYKKFEWILDVLSIIYKPTSLNCRIERKPSVNVLVNMYCNELRNKKMNDYKMLLESEKVPFLESKLETLRNIKADEESINVSCSVEEEITKTKAMLDKLRLSETITIHPVGTEFEVKQLAS